ncbi:hypothetical protein ESB00_07550 [Oleiharenicola lentus]|uniref:Uncharacterized protein n=1 Tax=Oleiharenicola lentus TaxID=2508720 RepID=A0A4V1M6K6_9BACT|nr:hypothetical protein [Oleiharenicola lentus]RXK55729.1 hypothetical protein ESB00_07550 [Oleiharenicola lentus]
MLPSYFRSGWAFLIPYLVAYLLYAWLKWPVNAGAGERGIENETGTWVPCLLHVYWTLHAIHLILGGIALRFWWKRTAQEKGEGYRGKGGPLVSGIQPSVSGLRPPPTVYRLLSTGYRLLPWACLALLFWIPGLYLEWPSDPWEHLRRINEWHILEQVTAHSSWTKSSYFLPYSLTGHTTGLAQLSLLNFYYTSVCLLLSWQYYRLARAVGLSERASFVFLLLNALTFGNNIFSFYRYYGLSSSILAQIGAIALTRITIEALGAQGKQVTPPSTGYRSLVRSLLPTPASLLKLCACTCALSALTALNHIQGLGIAGLGILAVVFWSLIKWKRAAFGWLAVVILLLSVATVLFIPRQYLPNSELLNLGWLTPWYGFNHCTPGSVAFVNMLGTVGLYGVLGLTVSLFLISHNNVAGWMTITPFLVLLCPFFSIPFANSIAGGITVYSRMFLAMPAGLALVITWHAALQSFRPTAGRTVNSMAPSSLSPQYITVCGALAAMVTIPSSSAWGPTRAQHLLAITPDDLQLKAIHSIASAVLERSTEETCRFISPAPTASIIHTLHPNLLGLSERRNCIARPISNSIFSVVAITASNRPMYSEEVASINRDPSVRHRDQWVSLDPDVAEFVAIEGFPPSGTGLQNPAGRRCTVFTAELIPINPRSAYFAELSIRQLTDTKATAYLCIAWYDANGRFLESSLPSPRGAGSPAGWGNGTFSYFGLIQDVAPASWTTYRISMGPSEPVSIPESASFLRIGAILNDASTPGARIQFTGAHIWQKHRDIPIIASGTFLSDEQIYVLLASPMLLSSTQSYTAFLSRHWPVNQVASDLAGGAELSALAHALARGPTPIIIRIENTHKVTDLRSAKPPIAKATTKGD